MKTEIEIYTQDAPFADAEIKGLISSIRRLEPIESSNTKVNLPRRNLGEFASLDPNIIKLIVDVANISAIGVILKGIFDIIIEMQKNRVQRIAVKVKDVSLEIPANASQDTIKGILEQVSAIARQFEADTTNRGPKKE